MIEDNLLKELLLNEFNGVKAVGIKWEILDKPLAYVSYPFLFIHIDMGYRDRLRNFPKVLREILRHELLHIKLGRDDKSKRFQRQCKKRKILLKAGTMFELANVKYKYGGEDTESTTSTSYSMVFNPFFD